MYELVVNLHMHTIYSDGGGTHKDIARAALQCGLDAVIVTDHNVTVAGPHGYYREGKKQVLMLIGEEVHDQTRTLQKNHLLAIGARREMATFAPNPQHLINGIRAAGGLSFLAHPHDPECKPIKEVDISWEDWSVHSFTGIELWNGMSELKTRGRSIFHVIFYVLFPHLIAHAPLKETINKWDELLSAGNKIICIGGSDAHAFRVRRGPFTKVIFPYSFHFKTINTHILVPNPPTGNVDVDGTMIYEALRAGHAFIGYDLPAATKGFRFSAQGRDAEALPGDEIAAEGGITFRMRLPSVGECHLLKDGVVIQRWKEQEICSYIATEPGVYRVEVYKQFWGKKRGWIFTNPIYVR